MVDFDLEVGFVVNCGVLFLFLKEEHGEYSEYIIGDNMGFFIMR